MTAEQFAALAQLTRMRAGPAQDAARLVLVDSITQAEAGRRTGLSAQGVYNAVTRARKAMEQAQIAAQQSTPAAVESERQWFLQTLGEWDCTEDVEKIFRLRLQRIAAQ